MSDSPYQSPQSATANGYADNSFTPPPSTIKTFGILHLVVAGLGLVCNVGGTIVSMFMGDFMDSISSSLPQKDRSTFSGLSGYMDEIAWVMWFYIICGVVLTIMLVIAGLGLLKNRESGLRMSLTYAWTSIATKIIYIVLTIIFVLPAASRMQQNMPGMNDAPEALKMANSFGAVMQIMTILGYCVYPVLVLCLLNNAKVKDYLRGR